MMPHIFLPFFIILSIVALIFILIKWSKSRNRKHVYTKRTYWLLGSYLMILLIASGLYFIIPKQDHAHSEQMIQDNIPNLADLVYEGKSLDEAHMYIQRQWEFPYEQNQLHIIGHYDNYPDFDVLISVERKTEDDGIVEITHYQTPIIIDGLDATEYMDPIEIELSSTALTISGIEYIDVELSTYKNDFPTRQFTGEKLSQDWGYAFGRQVLLLRIPKSMQIIDENENFEIHYVQE